MSQPIAPFTKLDSRTVDTALRLAMLGALYAAAVLFAAAFSPNMGFLEPTATTRIIQAS